MNFSQLFAIIRAAWVSIVVMVVVASVVAYLFSSSLTKEYSAKARVMLNVGNFDQTQYSMLERGGESSYIATQIRLVGDEGVMRDVATQLGWTTDPSVAAAWQQATGGKGDIATWAAHQLSSGVAARPFEDSAIIEIYYTAQSVDTAKAIVAMIRTAYIANDLKLRVDAARKASSWNRTVAAQALVTLRAAEEARATFMKANQIPVDSSNGSLEMLQMERSRAQSVPSTSTSLGLAMSPSMRSLQNQLNELDSEIAVLSQERGQNDALTINVMSLRDRIRTQLARETAFVRAGENATDAQIVANRALRNRQYLEARLQVLDRAPLYDKLATIDREILFRASLYQRAAQRVQDFDTVAAAPSGMKVIGDVIADDDMVFPNTPLTVALAAGLSLGLSIAIALLGEMMRRMVRGADDLEFYSGVPVLAVIPPTPQTRRFDRWRRLTALFRPGRRAVPGPA